MHHTSQQPMAIWVLVVNFKLGTIDETLASSQFYSQLRIRLAFLVYLIKQLAFSQLHCAQARIVTNPTFLAKLLNCQKPSGSWLDLSTGRGLIFYTDAWDRASICQLLDLYTNQACK